MIQLNKYIGLKLHESQKQKLLTLDDRFGHIMELCTKCRNLKVIVNIDEEWERFEKNYNNGCLYTPVLKYQDEVTIRENKLIEQIKELKYEFLHFDCFLSKYYIQNLDEQLQLMQHTVDVLDGKHSLLLLPKDTIENYELALNVLKSHPYEDSPDDKNISGYKAAKIIQNYIDDNDLEWKVVLNKNMLPRMGVSAEKKFSINPERNFSVADMEGLKSHEVDGHVARRYYGLKTGLRLFQYGLPGRKILDEGLAVWYSLNKSKKIKPNILFNIAFKHAIVYHINNKYFHELIDFAKEIAPNYPLRKIFKCIVRIKQETINLDDLGGVNTLGSYFKGYLLVDKMTDAERDDILKYNIGADQIKDLPSIKKFLQLNKFEPLI